MKNLKKTYLIIIGVVLLVASLIFVLVTKQSPISVSLVKIEKQEIENTIAASGVVKSESQAMLAFAASGRVSYLASETGDQISKGQLLAQIYEFPQNQSSQSAKDARDIAIRNKEAYLDANKNASKEFFESNEFKIQIRKYDELISQAEASYKSSIGTLENLKIKAPFTGIVLNVHKKVGEIATAGETIFEIADLSNIYFEVAIDQEDFGQIKLDQDVRINLEAYPNQIIYGKIYKLPQSAETVSTNTGSFIVKIKIDESSNSLTALIGMTGDADIVVEKSVGSVSVIPFDTIYRDEDSTYYVWTMLGKQIKRKNIKIGIEGNLYTEVIGLDNSDQVVTPIDSKVELTDGMLGKIID